MENKVSPQVEHFYSKLDKYASYHYSLESIAHAEIVMARIILTDYMVYVLRGDIVKCKHFENYIRDKADSPTCIIEYYKQNINTNKKFFRTESGYIYYSIEISTMRPTYTTHLDDNYINVINQCSRFYEALERIGKR